jgi:hypothetical protein
VYFAGQDQYERNLIGQPQAKEPQANARHDFAWEIHDIDDFEPIGNHATLDRPRAPFVPDKYRAIVRQHEKVSEQSHVDRTHDACRDQKGSQEGSTIPLGFSRARDGIRLGSRRIVWILRHSNSSGRTLRSACQTRIHN